MKKTSGIDFLLRHFHAAEPTRMEWLDIFYNELKGKFKLVKREKEILYEFNVKFGHALSKRTLRLYWDQWKSGGSWYAQCLTGGSKKTWFWLGDQFLDGKVRLQLTEPKADDKEELAISEKTKIFGEALKKVITSSNSTNFIQDLAKD